MEFQVRWAKRGSEDLIRILRYLDSQDPDWSDAFRDAISDRLEFLSRTPFLSSSYETIAGTEIREVLAGSYRLFFSVNVAKKTVRIERMLHVRQQDPDFSE